MVSIIVPVYNVEKYLRICLDSILRQTYKDYEVLLIDDGSPDGSPAICDEYAQKDSRFRVIHQVNKGLASARNTGIREAKGEYIYYIDSDDAINERLLEIVVAVADKTNANIVQINLQSVPSTFGMDEDYSKWPTCNYDIARDSAEDHEAPDYYHKNAKGNLSFSFDSVEALYNLDRDNQNIAKDIRLCTTVVWTKLYRTEAFKSLLFPEGMRMHEDQMTSHRRIAEAGGMVFLDLPLYYYRMSEVSLIRVGWTAKRLSILDCYEDRFDTVLKLGNRSLSDYIYYRTLVCMFRNFDMVCKNLKGEEKKSNRKMILARMKQLLRDGKGASLSLTKKLFFKTFVIIPNLYVRLFRLRNRIR